MGDFVFGAFVFLFVRIRSTVDHSLDLKHVCSCIKLYIFYIKVGALTLLGPGATASAPYYLNMNDVFFGSTLFFFIRNYLSVQP